jgi:hypothetical protein
VTFEGRELPTGSWTTFLRNAAKQPYDEMRDARPLQWVTRLLQAHPESKSAVCAAWAQLLGDDDDGVREQAIELVTGLPCDLGGTLAKTIERDHERLARVRASGDTAKSLLGLSVFQLHMLGPTIPISPSAARMLANIERVDDGWPWSLVLALRGDFAASLPRLVPALQRMDRTQIASVAQAMVLNGPPSTERGFEEVARAPVAVRDPFVAAVRDLEETDAMADLLGEARAPSRWPEFARRLGVAP